MIIPPFFLELFNIADTMDGNDTSIFRNFLLRRLVGVEMREYVPVAWSFAYFFCVLSSYYILRPIRETMAVGSGANTVAYLFMGTFVATMLVTPIFGWVASRYPRRVFLPWIYAFFISNILIFWYLFTQFVNDGTDHVWLGRAFFVWLSVFNLFVVSIFWSFMADIYNRDQGRRLFGIIASGGSIGALIGGAATSAIVVDIGFQNLFPIAGALLCLAILCIFRLRSLVVNDDDGVVENKSEFDKPLGGSPISGITHVFTSKYFLGIVANSIIASLLGNALYIFATQMVQDSIVGANAQTEFFSTINVWTNLFALIGQMFIVKNVVGRFGIGRSLAVLPFVSIIGFAMLAFDPVLAGVAILTIARRSIGFSFSKPATDMLYSVVSPEDKYKTKNFIDTAMYRFGDIIGAWPVQFLMGIGVSAVSFAMLPFAGVWFFVSLWLGRDYKRQAIALHKEGIE